MASSYVANGDLPGEGSKSDNGSCRVSIVTGFILCLLAVAVAVGVGVVVYFAGGREIICKCDQPAVVPPTVSPEALTQMCKDVIEDGKGNAICNVCPKETAQTTTSTTTQPASTTPIPTPTPTPTTSRLDYRLPITARPYHYKLELQPNIYGGDDSDFNFNGSVSIWTLAETAASTITLHKHPSLMIDGVITVMNVNNSESLTVTDTPYEDLREFFTLQLSKELVVGNHYRIDMSFSGPMKRDGRGLYLSSYDDNGQNVYLATTHFEAPSARKAFPCFDEPGLKATFDTTLVRQDGGARNYTSLSNAPKKSTVPLGNGLVADIYERTVVMPTYLLAFIVCDYQSLETEVARVKYRTWAMPTRFSFAQTAQDHGVEVFRKFAGYFTPSYVYPKLDNIAIPDFNAGAMENWGLITYRTRLLYEEGVSSASDENWIAEVISHEVAHMWFGNLVSPKWWNWLWLNEAFASFWDYHIVGEIYPEWKKLELHVATAVHGALSADSVRTSHPITADVMTPAEISSIFDTITYSKGSALIRMMHLAMGQALFIEGLNHYLKAHEYGNAEHKDLWNSLDLKALSIGRNMTRIMDPWVTQMNFPVVTVKVDTSDVRLTQKRFLLTGEADVVGTYRYKWTVPISYTTSASPNFTAEYLYDSVEYFYYDTDVYTLNVAVPSNGWIILNIQQGGFFRVNYDENNWKNIINFLENDDHSVIHPINRAQIINDAWNLAKAGLLAQDVALRTVNYLHKDKDYAPWRAFSREIGYVEDMLERTLLAWKLKQFIHKTVAGPYAEIGSNITESMPLLEKIHRAQVVSLACRFDYKPCTEEAIRKFQEWRNDNTTNPIYPDLRSSIYCTAVRHGGPEEWNFAYNMFHASPSTSEKDRLRTSLTCTKEPWLLRRVLEMSLDPKEIRPQDVRTTLGYVANNNWGRELAWNFITYNFTDIRNTLVRTSYLTRLINEVTRKYNTQFDYNQVKDFLDSTKEDDIRPGLEQALERIQTNMGWVKDNYAAFEGWLNTQ